MAPGEESTPSIQEELNAGLNFDQIASEFLRALRGKRSQAAFCRRLGYKSNVAYTWESGRGFPTAARTFEIASLLGLDIRAGLTRFYQLPPPWVDELPLTSRDGVATLLSDLRGKTSIVELAGYSGKTRFAVARWLKGEAEPRLNEFFQLVECASLRLVDFIESFVDPRSVPSIRARWESMTIARRLAYDAPWTQAVLRALELKSYRDQGAPPSGWLARQVGLPAEEEPRCLELLHQAGQIVPDGNHWRPVEVMALDVRRNPEAAVLLRGFWGRVAAERCERGTRGTMYTLCGVSSEDLERLRALEKAYFNEVRAIIAQSAPVQHVVLSLVSVVDLGESQAEVAKLQP